MSCDLEKTQITLNHENPAISLYFSKNLNPTYFPDCEIELSFTSLNEAPIDNPSSINKTLLDLNQKSFINVNFIKKWTFLPNSKKKKKQPVSICS